MNRLPSIRRDDFHLFLLAGQSNMAGRGKLDDDDDGLDISRVWAFSQAGEWLPARDPIHFDKPIAAIGPGPSFGAALAKHNSSLQIGLIPCAVGGSALAEWSADASHFVNAIARTQRAQQSGVLKGILWHQGESDALNIDDSTSYLECLITTIKNFRRELGNKLPIIVGEIGQFLPRDEYPGTTIINAALSELPRHIARVACVKSKELESSGDNVHFDRKSARELGRRYAQAYLQLSA